MPPRAKRPRASDFYEETAMDRALKFTLQASTPATPPRPLDLQHAEPSDDDAGALEESDFESDNASLGLPDEMDIYDNEFDSANVVAGPSKEIFSEEGSLLKPENQGKLYLTPLIATIIKPYFTIRPKIIPSAGIRRYNQTTVTEMAGNSESDLSPQFFEHDELQHIYDRQASLLRAPTMQKYFEGTKLARVRWGDENYEIGDTLILKCRSAIGSLRYTIDDVVRNPYTQLRFAKLIRISTAVGTSDGFGSIVLHVHYLKHSRATFLGNIARADELFHTNLVGDVGLKLVLGKCNVKLIFSSTGDVPKRGELPSPYHFFCSTSLEFTQGDAENENIFSSAFSSLKVNETNCRKCLQFGSIATASNHQPGRETLLNGTTYHRGDYIRVTGTTGLCDFAVILDFMPSQRSIRGYKFLRRDMGNESACTRTAIANEKRLALIKKSCVIEEQDVLGHCEIEYSADNQISDSRPFFFNEWTLVERGFTVDDLKSLTHNEAQQLYRECQECKEEIAKHLHYVQQCELRPLKLLDLFAGGGGLAYGLAESGRIHTAMAVEISPSACQTLRHNLPHGETGTTVVNECVNTFLKHATTCIRDCGCKDKSKRYLPSLLSDFDIISFGPPCPENSTLNRYAQKRDRNLSFFAALSYVDLLRPPYIVLENVPPIYKWKLCDDTIPHGGISLVIQCLFAMGYQIRFGKLNAQHYGAPQRRRRFFLIAALRSLTLPQLPQPTHYAPESDGNMRLTFENGTVSSPIKPAFNSALFFTPNVGQVTMDLPAFDWPILRESEGPRPAWLGCAPRATYATPFPRTLFQVRCRKDSDGQDLQHYTPVYDDATMERIRKIPSQEDANYNNLAPHYWEWHLAAVESARARGGFKKGAYERLKFDRYFMTITTNYGPKSKQSRVLHPLQKRVMTIRELARAQTFPDHWAFASKTGNVQDMIRQIGNAVSVVVASAIEEEIIRAHHHDWQKDAAVRDAGLSSAASNPNDPMVIDQ